MQLFERMEHESSKAYRAFVLYRDLGATRTVQRAWELYYGGENLPGSAPGYFRAWSSNYAWVERAQAWDDHQQSLADSVMGDEVIEEKRKAVVENGWRDYERMLAEWEGAMSRVKYHYTDEGGVVKDPKTGKDVLLRTVRMNVMEFLRMARWRLTIEQIGRLALGMPIRHKEPRAQDEDEALPLTALLDPDEQPNYSWHEGG
jgi:hypothetical protein